MSKQALREALKAHNTWKHFPEDGHLECICGETICAKFRLRHEETLDAWIDHVMAALAASKPRPGGDVVVLVKDGVPSFAPRLVNQAEPQQAGETSAPQVSGSELLEIAKRVPDELTGWTYWFDFSLKLNDLLASLAEPATPKPREGGGK